MIRPHFYGRSGLGGVGPLDFHERWKTSDTTCSTRTEQGRFGKAFYGFVEMPHLVVVGSVAKVPAVTISN